jgi:hypothetical protein
MGLPASTSAIQIGSEILIPTPADPGAPPNSYNVVRGQLESTAAAQSAGATVLPLTTTILTSAFAKGFFQNTAAINYEQTITLPDVRVVASQLYVTNSQGNSPAETQCYTPHSGGGIRTCSGGQMALQVGGVLAVQTNAAPPLMVEALHAVRDVRAMITQIADADINLQIWMGTVTYGPVLTIPAGKNMSQVVDGSTLPPTQERANLQLQVLTVGASQPGRDLTVTIRF